MNFTPKKNLGQNFLVDKKVIDFITKVGELKKNDFVLEVGPGNGALTEGILKEKPKTLTVIEKDTRLINVLEEKFGSKIIIINEDMMKFSFDNYLIKNSIIFGNLPYNISTQMLVRWIKITNLNIFCKKFILMFQKEVADRIIAEVNSKNYGRLSILSNWKMEIKKVLDIEPESFFPKPKVRSSLLTLIPKKKFFQLNDQKNLEHITNIFFSQKRKMIKKPLKFLFNNIDKISKELSLDLTLRPQNLDRDTYYKICKYYEGSVN